MAGLDDLSHLSTRWPDEEREKCKSLQRHIPDRAALYALLDELASCLVEVAFFSVILLVDECGCGSLETSSSKS